MSDEIYALDIRDETDVFTARHSAREVAAAVGVGAQDRVRLATALSEVSRDVLSSGGGHIGFVLTGPLMLEAVVTANGALDPRSSPGLEAAQRIMDLVGVGEDGSGRTVVTLSKQLAAPLVLDAAGHQELLRRLPADVVRSSLDELRTQNRELAVALGEVKSQRDELHRVNIELEETNRGVLALYDELSGELETTNQGVVALYAEIDDKSAQLREANESKTRFLNNISHELRTPGNSVLGLARLLLDPAAEPLSEEQRRQAEFISASAEDLLRLVDELLDLAKAESGRLEPAVAPVDLGELFEELRGTTAPLLSRPGVRLVVEPPRGIGTLDTDRTLLRHVLRNLLSNAVKFTESGTVSMTATGEGGVARIAVRDSGVGIAEDDQPRVFEEFFQVRGALQSQAKGSGLGLPFARRVARVLGGDLLLTSAPGQGSTFTVELPVAGPPDVPSTGPAEEATS